MKRPVTFLIEMAYLMLLLTIGAIFFVRRGYFSAVPDNVGPIPIGVPWFGAVGAVLLSLSGVFEHIKDWEEEFWPWHVARPFIGAVIGIVSVLILKAGILAVGSNVTPNSTTQPTNLLYYLIAFLVGYREETFRELIKRLTDVILASGSTPAATFPTITSVAPSTAPHGTPTSIIVTGTGFTNLISVQFDTKAAQTAKRDSDTQLTVTTPVMPTASNVNIVVKTKSGSTTFPFTFS